MDSDRGIGRDGRRAAAGGDDGRRFDPRRRMPAEPYRDAPAHRLSRRARPRPRRGARDDPDVLRERKPLSVGVLGNAADVFPELVRRGVRPDVVTDQTSAHDPLQRLSAERLDARRVADPRQNDPKAVAKAAKHSMVEHVQAMLDFHKAGIPTLDYGNNIRQMAMDEGLEHAFDFPGFVPAYIRPMFCRGIGPFRWAALVGRS